MRRHRVDPYQLSKLQNAVGVDVLVPFSSCTNGDQSNGDLNTFHLAYSVDFYDQARPKHLQVFGYRNAGPIIDLRWSKKADEPKIEVLTDGTVTIPTPSEARKGK